MKKSYKFPKKARLKTSDQFERVYRNGRLIKKYPLRVHALRRKGDDGGQSRLGLSIGTKVGSATVRNLWKRRIREVFRLHRHSLSAPYDFVVGVSWSSSVQDAGMVDDAFVQTVSELNDSGAESRR